MFTRKPRGTDELAHWKATEYRTFLLYLGPLALKNLLLDEKYAHFLLFHTAMYILVSPAGRQPEWVKCAEGLLQLFVNQIPTLYFKELLAYNMHRLLHLADDVRRHGPLDKFSAFPFENYMQTFKRMIRSNSQHLSQMVRRVSEIDNIVPANFNVSQVDKKTGLKRMKCFLAKSGQVGLIGIGNDQKYTVKYFRKILRRILSAVPSYSF